MKEKLLKFLPSLQRLSLAGVIFLTPLVFLTNGTKNPYIVQSLVLSVLLCAALLFYAVQVFLKRETGLKISLIDLFVLLFTAVSLLSFFYNLFFDGKFLALLGEFSHKADVFVFSFLGGWFLSKYINPQSEGSFSAKFYGLLFLWTLCWLPFKLFGGVFICLYVTAMLCWGVYICYMRLDKITVFTVCDILIGTGAVCCFYGILQNAGIEPLWRININSEFGSRAISTFGNPNFLSSYLVLLLPVTFLRFMRAKSGGEQVTFLCILALFCAYTAISMTRSSWLGIIISGLFLLCFKDFRRLLVKGKTKTMFITAVCLGVFFLWPASLTDENKETYSSAAAVRLGELENMNKFSAFGLNAPADKLNFAYHQRLMMWACGIEMFKQSPLLGKGMTSFQMNYGLCQGGLMFKNPALGELKTQANEAHNQFIQVLAESGILGIAAFMLLVLGGFYLIVKTALKKEPEYTRLFYLSLTGGLIAFLADNMLNITIRAAVPAFAFWLLFGMAAGLCAVCKTKQIKRTGVYVILFAAIILSVLGIWWQASYFKAEVNALKGYKAFALKDYDKALTELKKADANPAVRAEAVFMVVNILIQQQKYKQAQEFAARGIKKYPGYYEFYLRYSALMNAFNDNIAAAESLKTALELYPANLSAAQAWANYYAALEPLQSKENTEFTGKLLKFFPYDQSLKLAYTAGLYGDKKYSEACSLAAKELEFDIYNPDFFNIVSLCHQNGFANQPLIDKASALRSARAEVKKEKYNPVLENKVKDLFERYAANAGSALLLAEVYFNKGDYQAAASVLEPYYQANKHLKPLCFALSSVYHKAGWAEKAKEPLLAVLSYDKSDEQARKRLENLENLKKNALQAPLN